MGGSVDTNFANSVSLFIELGAPGTTPVAAGSYPITSNQTLTESQAIASLSTTDATCVSVVNLEATAGTITVTSVSTTSVSGTYSLTFNGLDGGAGGTLTGSFTTALCTVSFPLNRNGGSIDAGPQTCQQ
jgi:hypothetical protein